MLAYKKLACWIRSVRGPTEGGLKSQKRTVRENGCEFNQSLSSVYPPYFNISAVIPSTLAVFVFSDCFHYLLPFVFSSLYTLPSPLIISTHLNGLTFSLYINLIFKVFQSSYFNIFSRHSFSQSFTYYPLLLTFVSISLSSITSFQYSLLSSL